MSSLWQRAETTGRMLIQAIRYQEEQIAILEGSTNPQIQEVLIKRKAERDAFQAALQALHGDYFLLNTYTHRLDNETLTIKY